MNELVQSIFKDFQVNGVSIPVSFLFYVGHDEPYITYQFVDSDSSLSGDNDLIGYVVYYDFDIFSKGNYTDIVESVKSLLKKNDFIWQPSKSGPDMYEPDTGYYHKTLNFAYIKEL